MTTIQRIIKYFATVLAILIIVGIISAILLSTNIFSDILSIARENIGVSSSEEKSKIEIGNTQNNNKVETSKKYNKEFENSQITSMKIDLAYAVLTIRQGEKFAVEANTTNIESKQNSNQLVVKEKNANLYVKRNPRTVIVTLPKNVVLENARIKAGSGEIQIEKLDCQNLDLSMGAGKMTVQELQVVQKAKIEGGAGKVEILSGEMNNLDLEMGIGSFKLVTVLTGNNKIEAGVGKLDLNLTDGIENYTIKASKGIGAITISGKEVKDGSTYGQGKTNVKINGGIGNITIEGEKHD